ncbi:MAG TPA: gliding motility protein GldM [Lacibacter sp.]|nr:gliding motility protein GldM [Lacibacter sp.]
MALPKEPRQKMINLMYLVLTALLALNVSAEIINAFKVVDNSLTTTNTIVNRSTETIMESFKIKLAAPESKAKAEVWMPKAESAVKLTKEITDYIEQLKLKLKVEAGYDPKDPESKFKEDNVDIATRIMDKQGEGEKLRAKLEQYKKAMLAIDPEVGKMFEKNLPINTEIPKSTTRQMGKVTWASAYFHMTPTVAALTMLSKFQNDVKTTESRLVNEFHNRVGQVVVRFDAFEPIVGASSTYLFPGQELEVTAGLGAYSKAKLPEVYIQGARAELNEKGLAIKKIKVGSTSGSVKVIVKYTDQDGNPQEKPYDLNYTVGTATGAFVSAEKVKVLYIGLDNELAVSGGNVGDEKVTVAINNGSLSKIGPGRYIAKPASPGKAIVTVNSDGKPSSFEFRVKTVPDPVAVVGASKGGRIQSNIFKAQRGVRADLENFVFEGVQFNVTSYVIYLTGAGFPDPQYRQVNGNSFDAVQDLINKAKPGTTVTIDEIYVTGPGGRRKIPGPFFNLY